MAAAQLLTVMTAIAANSFRPNPTLRGGRRACNAHSAIRILTKSPAHSLPNNLQSLDSGSKLSDNACELRKRVATCRTNDIYLGIVSPFVADIFKGKMSILDGIRSVGNEYLDFFSSSLPLRRVWSSFLWWERLAEFRCRSPMRMPAILMLRRRRKIPCLSCRKAWFSRRDMTS